MDAHNFESAWKKFQLWREKQKWKYFDWNEDPAARIEADAGDLLWFGDFLQATEDGETDVFDLIHRTIARMGDGNCAWTELSHAQSPRVLNGWALLRNTFVELHAAGAIPGEEGVRSPTKAQCLNSTDETKGKKIRTNDVPRPAGFACGPQTEGEELTLLQRRAYHPEVSPVGKTATKSDPESQSSSTELVELESDAPRLGWLCLFGVC